MGKLFVVFLSATLLSSVVFADEDKIVATYKGGEVKESQIMQQFQPVLDMQPELKGRKFSELDSNLQENLTRTYINDKLLEQEAKTSGIESSKEFQDKLSNLKTQMIKRELIEKRLKSAVSDKMVDEEYNKLAAILKGKEEAKVSHILVDKEKTAKDIKKKLNKGEKFATLAKSFSKDEGSKANGGEIGYFTEGSLVPEFEQKVSSMKINEVSDPVKTQFGWHIIKVLDKRPAKIPSKEEALANIKVKLNKEAVEKYLEELTNKADIKLSLPVKPINDKPVEGNDKTTK